MIAPVSPEHPSEPHADPAVQALIDDGWLEEVGHPCTVGELEHAVSIVRDVDARLRELAEWLVSLDGHPLLVDRPTPGDMRAIIRRAQEALGQTEGPS
jgi:hypothetical protein